MEAQWIAGNIFSHCLPDPWQVHGAAEAALLAASATARAEVATASVAPERLAQEGPSLQLPEDVLQLARRLTAVAVQSIARSSAHPQKDQGLEVRDCLVSTSSATMSHPKQMQDEHQQHDSYVTEVEDWLGLISLICICAMSLYAMHTQATYKLYQCGAAVREEECGCSAHLPRSSQKRISSQ